MDEYMDVETVLNDIYGTGLYHYVLIILASMTCFVAAMEVQTMIFMHYTPPFICSDARLAVYELVSWIDKNEYDRRMGQTSNQIVTINPSATTSEQCWGLLAANNTLVPFACAQWEYQSSQMRNSVTMQFDLICGRGHWIPWMEAAFLFFSAIGYVIAFAGDYFGRKIPFLLFASWGMIVSLITPFVKSLPLLLCLRCFAGISTAVRYLGMTILSELVPLQHRAAFGTVYFMAWSLGYMTTAGMAYPLKDWKMIRLWCCTFFMIYLTYPFLVFESPRWLCARGRRREAITILQRVAKWNRARLPANYFEKVDKILTVDTSERSKPIEANGCAQTDQRSEIPVAMGERSRSDHCWDMLTHANLRRHTFVFFFAQSAVAVVYFAIVIDGIFAIDNLYLNVFLMGLVELPSSILAWAASSLLGRRSSTVLLLTFTAIAVISAKLVGASLPALRTFCALAGKLFLAACYCVADIYIAELYPTSIRNIGFFSVITVASICSAIAPFLNELVQVYVYLPSILYASMCITAAALIYFCLPETKNCPLAQNVDDAKDFARGKEKAWTQRMHQRYQSLLSKVTEVTKL